MLFGCASKGVPVPFTLPDIGVITTKNVGDDLIKQGTGNLKPFLIILNDEVVNNLPLRKGAYEYDDQNSRHLHFTHDESDLFFLKELPC